MVERNVKDPDKEKEESGEEKEKQKKKEKPKLDQREQPRVVIRLMNTDLDGDKKVLYALRGVKGLSYSVAKAVCNVAGVNPDVKLGSLGEDILKKLESAIKDPAGHEIPVWMLNRRKDMETGKDMHLSGTDVKVAEKFDIKAMVDKKSYKGVRHMLGLPVRGQRTRSSFRKGKTVGVVRKKMLAATAQKKEKEK